MEVTPLVVNQANDIVNDAKKIATDDIFLDRIKKFVPAGNNPVYPDVLVTVSAVRQSLGRCMKNLESRQKHILQSLLRARTVVGALEYYLQEDEENNQPSKNDVEAILDGGVADFCFSWDSENNFHYFDFDRLDSQSIDQYLAMSDELEANEEEAHEEGEVEDETEDGDEES